MKLSRREAVASLGLLGLHLSVSGCAGLQKQKGAPVARPRVLVSTDIGGSDPDDFQSMVHLLLLADMIDLEGLVSSPWGAGRKSDILTVIDRYAADFSNIRRYSPQYPTPEYLRSITFQGETESAPFAGWRRPTDGSNQIIECARRSDPRPLDVLVWGGIEDLAQALHDAPDILPKLRVYWIGGPNKKWSPDAYQYIAAIHPSLWIIESNSTYRGWFVGGDQEGPWGNSGFVAEHVAGHGALGEFFAGQLGGSIKMGDSPSVGWALSPQRYDPRQPGWGGHYVRAWDRSEARFDRVTTSQDLMEVFGILHLTLRTDAAKKPSATMVIENQQLPGYWDGAGIHFRFSPKEVKRFDYRIESEIASLNRLIGSITAEPPRVTIADPRWPNWWADDPDAALAEGPHDGAKTVSRWRKAVLSDFADRMDRCLVPAS